MREGNPLTGAIKVVGDGVQEGVLWSQEPLHHRHLEQLEKSDADSQKVSAQLHHGVVKTSRHSSWGEPQPLIQTAAGGEEERSKEREELEVPFKLRPEEQLSGSPPPVSSSITASASPPSA